MGSVNVNARMRIVGESPSEILLRYDVRPATTLFLVMSAGLWAAFRFIPAPPRWFAVAAIGLFLLICVVGVFWREELELSLARGRWRRRAGWVGNVTETSGDLSEIPEVALELTRVASSEDASPTWNVEIRAPTWPNAVVLGSTTREEDGYAQLERWAKVLERDAVDRTGTRVVRTGLAALDAPLSERGAPEPAADSFPARVSSQPPRGSRIVVTSERGRRRVVVPPVGYNVGTAMIAGFGAVFGGFGGLAALVGAGVITGVRVNGEIPNGPVWVMAALGSLFFLIGMVLVLAALVGGKTTEWVEDAPDRLVVGFSGIGLTWGRKTFLKREVEAVDLSLSPGAAWSKVTAKRDGRSGPPAGAALDVRIRTHDRVLRIGRDLPEADQAWLRDTLDAMVRGS